MIRALILLLLWVAATAAVITSPKKPGVLILCEQGGVYRSESHVASGSNCVLHDRSGGALTVGSISVYDDGMGP